ncbi:glucoamylase [Roseiarcus fermentans]|uniref:glucan 1,4-alpha-glucosidase n=1 Tax=Roseiarcus fermentans TaxID=1473586 RepID=A0A366FN97_9HYPH|nr:glycoside hydrolase family 15 protein [Roseiarcus fermentans]RBP16047.1 glucoamylase [Roseiarcus fermentans]
MPTIDYALRQFAIKEVDLQSIAQHMYPLMLRNISGAGFVFVDPGDPSRFSAPGCVLASPSYPANQAYITQNYVYNWVRDAAIAAIEVAAANPPSRPGGGAQTLIDYVTFARLCQSNAIQAGKPTHACFTIEGDLRDWTDQSDGPALQTLAILSLYGQLDPASQAVALAVANANVGFVLDVYQQPTVNLWEEVTGYSFFARAVQLRCLEAVQANTIGLDIPSNLGAAITWLTSALEGHWNGSCYVSILQPQNPRPGYDSNIDIVCASVYGAIPFTDTKLLATAAQVRSEFADAGGPNAYPINAADAAQGFGPLMGRYPGDTYDGDSLNAGADHPWALCTANFSELYYGLAHAILSGAAVPYDSLSAKFFEQVGVQSTTTAADAIAALRTAGDAMLQAVVYHSDNLLLSEQFDAWTGYEKSVRNLTWSYAAFLSAVRRRNGTGVSG